VHGAAVGYVALVVAGIAFGADWLATAVAVSLSAVVGLRSLAIERL
jgi:orotate phosphoribosyltransferase